MSLHIDAHQHFWHPARGDYFWMPADDPVLSRPYRPADLAPLMQDAGISRSVLVQAAPTIEETEYLLGIADACDTVAGVVGWIDFEKPNHIHHLHRFAKHPKFLGVRPMIQDIADVDWMLRFDLGWAFEALIELDLSFDALGFPHHLANFLTLFTRYPELRVVVDHCMKPQIVDFPSDPAAFDDWAKGIAKIAEQTGAFCKLSGLVTESAVQWTVEDLQPFVQHVLTVFGPQRLMWGSDWPVCGVRASYPEWRTAAETLCAELDTTAKAQLYGGTAQQFYRL